MALPETSLTADVALCQCGCGEPAPIAKMTDRDRGRVKGRPLRFVRGHNARRTPHAFEVNAETGCHEWVRYVSADGYGWVRCPRTGQIRPAHLVAYETAHGAVPPHHEVHHRCKNRRCVHLDHLRMVHEGAHKRLHSKLTDADVAIIRATAKTYGSGLALARRFDVTPSVISAIRTGRTWREVPSV